MITLIDDRAEDNVLSGTKAVCHLRHDLIDLGDAAIHPADDIHEDAVQLGRPVAQV